jgi:hypothetical protein
MQFPSFAISARVLAIQVQHLQSKPPCTMEANIVHCLTVRRCDCSERGLRVAPWSACFNRVFITHNRTILERHRQERTDGSMMVVVQLRKHVASSYCVSCAPEEPRSPMPHKAQGELP